jgi:hypothetical protein
MTTNARPIRFTAIGTALALLSATAVALLASSGTASATGHPDLKITQHISGSSQSGHTFDTITVKNNGSLKARYVSLQLYTNTGGSFDNSYSGHVTCEVMPAPTGYSDATACQFVDSISAGDSASFKGDFSGPVGAKFTTLATVGDFEGDANYNDNRSTVTSWFGPRANLGVGGTAKPGTKTGHLTAVTTVVNRGPNTAENLQEVVEVKKLNGVLGSGSSGSCQTVPPASGYDFAFSCVKNSLAQGGAWKITFDYTGHSGDTATMVTTVTSQTKDPFTNNNKMTRNAKVK